ncbi:hypothetical protein MA16_Dca010034 [Dendrobium catenatum]|uniref:Uncharacterized protein n=1 Tax=Dendrobium catenatum TaxID=906689 RepID=A0A2I0VJ48_9ASPA|nr:hypothetical protein MA16_Dca010034 [Dendrobium catenatum]
MNCSSYSYADDWRWLLDVSEYGEWKLDLIVAAAVGYDGLEECPIVDWGVQIVVSTMTARLKEVEGNQRWHGDIPKENEADGHSAAAAGSQRSIAGRQGRLHAADGAMRSRVMRVRAGAGPAFGQAGRRAAGHAHSGRHRPHGRALHWGSGVRGQAGTE